MENSLDGINNSFDTTQGMFCELEDITIETFLNETERKKKTEESSRQLEVGIGLEEIMAEHFSEDEHCKPTDKMLNESQAEEI